MKPHKPPWLLGFVAVLTAASVMSHPVSEEDKICRVGANLTLPRDIFASYAGWDCYETACAGAETHRFRVYACTAESRISDSRHSIPCFKSGSETMNFDLAETRVADAVRIACSESFDLVFRCYLSAVATCETAPDGWFNRDIVSKFVLTEGRDCGLEGESKFHVAMLSVSLIVGIPVAAFLLYGSLKPKASGNGKSLCRCLSPWRNLLLVLLLRTLLTLLVETEVVSKKIEFPDEPLTNWRGCEAIVAFESIALGMVVTFWLILTATFVDRYLADSTPVPHSRFLAYGAIGLAVLLWLVWLTVMAVGDYPNCWLDPSPLQWIQNSVRLVYILCQIACFTVLVRRVIVFLQNPTTFDRWNLRFIAFLTAVFLVHFALNASHPTDPSGSEAHVYTEYFFDGLQCALVAVISLVLVKFQDARSIPDILGFSRTKKCHRVFETFGPVQLELEIGKATPLPPLRLQTPAPALDNARGDITYSTVLTPERFEKTIMLYNRLNIIPKAHDAESVHSEYYDVESIRTEYGDVISASPTIEDKPYMYTSKYLISNVVGESESLSSESSVDLPKRDTDRERVTEEWVENCRRSPVLRPRSIFGTSSASSFNIPRKEVIDGPVYSIREAEETGPRPRSCSDASNQSGMRAPRRRGSAPEIQCDLGQQVVRKPLPSIYNDLQEFRWRRKLKGGESRAEKVPNRREAWSRYKKRLMEESKRRSRESEAKEEDVEVVNV